MKTKLEQSEKRQGVKALATRFKWPFEEEEVESLSKTLRKVASKIDRAQSIDQTFVYRASFPQGMY